MVEAQQNASLLQGVVKDAKVGESYLGLEPLTRFVSVTVSTPLGDVELCHPMELVAEGQRDLVKPGSVVSALCELSGNCAAGEYAASSLTRTGTGPRCPPSSGRAEGRGCGPCCGATAHAPFWKTGRRGRKTPWPC